MPPVEQELLNLTVHPSSFRFWVKFVLLNLTFSVQYFVDHCLSFWPFSFDNFIVCPFVCRFTASDYPFGIFKLYLYYPKGPTLFGIRYSSILPTGEATVLHLPRRASTNKYVFEVYQFCLSFYDLLILFWTAMTVRYLLCPAHDSMRRYSSCCAFLFVRPASFCWMQLFWGLL